MSEEQEDVNAGISHEHLLTIVHALPEDYLPWGQDDRAWGGWGNDCSMGCKWAAWLDGHLGGDWCVCTSPTSHRRGLVTFEHQGCRHFEYEDDDDDADGPA